MAITIPPDEKLLERLTARVGGKLQEFVLTDKAVYYEGQRSPVSTWLSAILFPIATLLGVGLFYYYLRGGPAVRAALLGTSRCVTTRRMPLPVIANLGGLLALLFGLNFAFWAYPHSGDVPKDVLHSLLVGYGVAILICLGATFFLLRFQRSSLSVNALNGNFTFDTYRSFDEMQRVQERIWQARAELLSRAINWPGVPR